MFYKKPKLKPLFAAAFALVLLLILKFIFSSLEDSITEPKQLRFLSIQWLCYTIVILTAFVYLLNEMLNMVLPWKKYTGFRFVLQLITGTLLSLGSINLAYSFIKTQFTQAPPDFNQLLLLNIYGAAIILPIFSLFFGYKFIKAWRKSELESERLSKENTRSQLMSLRNHLDPHFLFNNLNILSSLMDKDIGLSKEYLNKFAEVYRVILKTEYSDLTTVEDELKLIESYVYLITIRFQKAVFFSVDVSKETLEKAMPPLSIQMLIENAIKHNLATKDKPIYIKVYEQDNFLVVENNIQKKKYLPKEREATGLNNIQKRYEFFTDKNVLIEEINGKFTIKLPLIEIDYD